MRREIEVDWIKLSSHIVADDGMLAQMELIYLHGVSVGVSIFAKASKGEYR